MKFINRFILALSIICSLSVYSQNNSQKLNGITSYIDLGDSVGNGLRTIEMWINPNIEITPNMSNFQIAIQRNDITTNNDEFALIFDKSTANNPGHLRFKLNESNGTLHEVISDTNRWGKGVWYHVAAVIDSLEGMMLFIDGVKQKSIDSTWKSPLNNSSNPTSIGRQGNQSTGYFDGKIDEVRLSTTARYVQNFTPDCRFTVDVNTRGLYHLDTIFANSTPDNSGNRFDGTLNNIVLNGSIPCPYDFGNPKNHSQSFNGLNSYIDIGDSVVNGVRTIEMWVQPNDVITPSISEFQIAIHRNGLLTNNNEVALHFEKSTSNFPGHFRFKLNDSNGGLHEVISDTNRFKKNQWYHMAAVIDSLEGMMLFIDGEKQKSIDSTWKSPINSSVDPTYIGRQGNQSTGYFDGNIDEVRLSTIARYSQNFNPKCNFMDDIHVRGLYKLDTIVNGPKGSSTPDQSQNKFHGLVNGSKLSDAVSCITTSLLSEYNKKVKIIKFYPNPTNNTVTINSKILNLKVFDISGKIMIEKSNLYLDENTIDISSLNVGIYFFQVIDFRNEFINKRIIKQ